MKKLILAAAAAAAIVVCAAPTFAGEGFSSQAANTQAGGGYGIVVHTLNGK